ITPVLTPAYSFHCPKVARLTASSSGCAPMNRTFSLTGSGGWGTGVAAAAGRAPSVASTATAASTVAIRWSRIPQPPVVVWRAKARSCCAFVQEDVRRCESWTGSGRGRDGRSHGRQREPDVGPAAGAVRPRGPAAVRLGDGAHDGQAETGTRPLARAVGPREPLEGPVAEAVGKARAVVAHVELDDPVPLAGGELDRPAAVAERVVHQVAERLL